MRFSYPSPRVLQLDAGILDGELYSLLKQQLSDAFQLLSSKSFSYNMHPELWSLLLKLLLFRVTTLKTGSSYGYQLQNLKLSDRKTGKVIGKKLRYILLSTIIGQYLFEKAKSYLYNLEESQLSHSKIWLQKIKMLIYRFRTHLLRVTDDLVKIAGVINFVLFLIQGQYSSLLHRVLGIVITPLNPDLLKFNGNNVSFEFQNRQLVWNVMTEFLVFVIPLLHVQKWRRLLRSMVAKKAEITNDSSKAAQTRFTALPIFQCAICIEVSEASGMKAASTQVTNAHVTSCGHIFCYICLVTRRNAAENGNELAELCPRCSRKITFFKDYEDDDSVAQKAAILVEYEDAEYSDHSSVSDEVDGLDESNDNISGNKQLELDLDLELNLHLDQESEYSENEDLEEEMDGGSDFDDEDYGSEIDFE